MRPSRIIKPGKRIGHLHVLSHILDGSGKGSWECECDCGRIITRATPSSMTPHGSHSHPSRPSRRRTPWPAT